MRRVLATARICRGSARSPASGLRRQVKLHDWLTHAQSLTARIRATGARFEVQLLNAGRAPCVAWERRCLRLRGPAYVRQVILLADDIPVVWARTVLAQPDLRRAWRFLRGLGRRPLGSRLFTDPGIRREPFRYLNGATLRQLLRTSAVPLQHPAVGRSALLLRQRRPALLTEVLLPGLLALESVQDGGWQDAAVSPPAGADPQPVWFDPHSAATVQSNAPESWPSGRRHSPAKGA